MDEVVDPKITIKVIGHQWYWSASFHESDKSLTKCTRLVYKASSLLKDKTKSFSFDVKRLKKL